MIVMVKAESTHHAEKSFPTYYVIVTKKSSYDIMSTMGKWNHKLSYSPIGDIQFDSFFVFFFRHA